LHHLKKLGKYFWRYRVRLLLGLLFIVISNYFGVLSPQVTKYVINRVKEQVEAKQVGGPVAAVSNAEHSTYDPLVRQLTGWMDGFSTFGKVVALCGITLVLLALLRGFFMFMMRQTIIVMSRHIEYDQKNDIFSHYQRLDTQFFKTHSTGDLMNRVAEDVSRVRMFTGPAIMYSMNLLVLITLSVYYMMKTNVQLTLYTVLPLPLLAFIIYKVNTIINRKSEKQQEQLSNLTTHAQESYAGIKVIKSFAQEKSLLRFFNQSSLDYRDRAISLAQTESWYFPAIALLIGVSTLLTIMAGGFLKMEHDSLIAKGLQVANRVDEGVIVEFVVYINMLTFPVSAIGWVASMIQRAAASQKRINEFLLQEPGVTDVAGATQQKITGAIRFNHLSFTYPHTGIQALKDVNFEIKPGEKVAVIGKTGSGKSTLAQLLLRMYNVPANSLQIDGRSIETYSLQSLRSQISYVPQDVFLFSDTVAANIAYANGDGDMEAVRAAAEMAHVARDIEGFAQQYETVVGERGVTLSGGQKQRVSIARALAKPGRIVIFDDCLSAVDAKTEQAIITSLNQYLQGRTAIIITHRIFALLRFDKIIVLHEGAVVEQGAHEELMALNGHYRRLYEQQQRFENEAGMEA
jgi:ATP-binding cassette, subfamily B, multidrug efflux pump